MIPFLRKNSHADVGLTFLGLIEATHAVRQGEFSRAGDLIAAVPEHCRIDPIEDFAWSTLHRVVSMLIENKAETVLQPEQPGPRKLGEHACDDAPFASES
jgi:hypothetical protein